MTETTETALPRYRVVGGGEPTAEQLAALVVALTPIAGVDGGADAVPAGPTEGGWARAALLEGVGERILVSADDLAAFHAGL